MEQEYSTNLTLSDLKLIASLIEACTQRGVFRANELAIVGELYNKINSTLINIKDDNKGDTDS
jgi:hypothetical protein